MMNGLNHGWGMGWSWIAGLIVLVIIIWLVVNAVKQKNNPNKQRKTIQK